MLPLYTGHPYTGNSNAGQNVHYYESIPWTFRLYGIRGLALTDVRCTGTYCNTRNRFTRNLTFELDGDEVNFLLFASGSEVEDHISFFGFGLRI